MLPGTEFEVLVNGEPVPCVVDEYGTWRFKEDPSVTYKGVPVTAEPGPRPGQMDWNALCVDKSVSFKDRLKMHFASGYSLSGFCDLSLAQHCKIESPEWTHDPFVERDLLAEIDEVLGNLESVDNVQMYDLLSRVKEALQTLVEERL